MTIPFNPKPKRKRGLVQVRFSDDERTAFLQAASAAHLNLSAWIRTRLWMAARREKSKLPPDEVKS